MFVISLFDPATGQPGDGRWSPTIEDAGLTELRCARGATWSGCEFSPREADARRPTGMAVRGERVFVFDGVLDYRAELCAELSVSVGSSDVELFVLAYERWGEACPQRLHGDYAGTVWDGARRRLWAATDHCAEVKLYFARHRHGLVLSNHLPSVACTEGVDSGMDWQALTHLIIGYLPCDPGCTVHRGIRYLAPGCALTWTMATAPRQIAWCEDSSAIPEQRKLRAGDMEAFVETFRAAVATRLSRGGPTGATVSGGLDSTLVAGHAAKLASERGACVMGYTAVPNPKLPLPRRRDWEPSDWPYAQSLAARHPNLHLQAVTTGHECLLDLFDRIHARVGTPVRNGANHAWSLDMAERVRHSGGDVLLTGQRGNLGVSRACPTNPLAALLRGAEFGQAATIVSRAALRRFKLGIERWSSTWFDRSPSYEPPPPGDFSTWSGLCEPRALAAAKDSARRASELVMTRPMAIVRVNIAFVADPWAYTGVRYRDPTADRRVLEALSRLPAIAHFWSGRPRGVARRAGAGVVPEVIRRRLTRGSQVPDEPALPRLYAERYRAAWHVARRSPWLAEYFDLRRLDAGFERFIAARADRFEALLCHRILDTARFVEHVARRPASAGASRPHGVVASPTSKGRPFAR